MPYFSRNHLESGDEQARENDLVVAGHRVHIENSDNLEL